MHCVQPEFLVKRDSKEVEQVRILFRTFKIRYRINWIQNEKYDLPCRANVKRNFVTLNIFPDYDRDTFCSFACHEVIHILDSRFGLFKRVYDIDIPKDRREFNWYKKKSLEMELETDKRARYLCSLYFPSIKYVRGYNRDGIKYYNNILMKEVEEEMIRRRND